MKAIRCLGLLVGCLSLVLSGSAQQDETSNAGRMVGFSGSLNNNQVILNWSSSFDINNTGYDIERRDESGVWHVIGSARTGANTSSGVSYDFTDATPNTGDNFYRLRQADGKGGFYYTSPLNVELKKGYEGSLFQNYPNPFTDITTIRYEMRKEGPVRIAVFDMSGKQLALVINQVQAKGSYTVKWNGSGFSPGTYIYKILTNEDHVTQKMIKAN